MPHGDAVVVVVVVVVGAGVVDVVVLVVVVVDVVLVVVVGVTHVVLSRSHVPLQQSVLAPQLFPVATQQVPFTHWARSQQGTWSEQAAPGPKNVWQQTLILQLTPSPAQMFPQVPQLALSAR